MKKKEEKEEFAWVMECSPNNEIRVLTKFPEVYSVHNLFICIIVPLKIEETFLNFVFTLSYFYLVEHASRLASGFQLILLVL